MQANSNRDYYEDYKTDYPIGIVLGESQYKRKKAKDIEDKLNENTQLGGILGGLLSAGALGLGTYFGTKDIINPNAPLYQRLLPTLIGSIGGYSIGRSVTPMLVRYLNYKKLAEKEGVDVGTLNYSSLDEAGQVARILKKNEDDIKKYQEINTKLKAAEMTAGSLGAYTAAAGLGVAGFPAAGALLKLPIYDQIGQYGKNKMYQKLLNN